MLYKQAAKIAIDTCEKLKPFCDVINIVGSLRRAVPEITDIDLICVPRYTEIVALDLFNETPAPVVKKVSVSFKEIIKSIGVVTKGTPDGRYISLQHQYWHGRAKDVKIDIFMPNPVDYYRQYCIRTGSANFVHWNIAKKME